VGRSQQPDWVSDGRQSTPTPAVQDPRAQDPWEQRAPEQRLVRRRVGPARRKDPGTARFAAPSSYPTGPVPAFTGEAAITEVLDVALRVGEVLLSSGAATADVIARACPPNRGGICGSADVGAAFGGTQTQVLGVVHGFVEQGGDVTVIEGVDDVAAAAHGGDQSHGA